MTDAIVLAAGLGQRLAGAAGGPKWLVPVGDSTPASAQLAAFDASSMAQVYVVVPPDAAPIEAFVAPWRDRLELELVPNELSASRNNWYSVLLGLRCALARATSDVVVVNSDLYASTAWFTELLGRVTSSGRPAALAVDPRRGRTDEAMKVRVDDDRAEVIAIGKRGIAPPDGEYVGLAWWSAASAAELAEVLAGFVDDPTSIDHWYEHGIQRHLAAGGQYAAVDVPSSKWVEIDDPVDLQTARSLWGPRGASDHLRASAGGEL